MKKIIRSIKKACYRVAEESAAVNGRYQEALYWGKKGEQV